MGALITQFAAWMAGNEVLKWIAFKVVLTTIITITVPIILWNFKIDWAVGVFDLVESQFPEGSSLANFTGLAGWFCARFRIADCFNVIMSAYASKFAISFIRGI